MKKFLKSFITTCLLANLSVPILADTITTTYVISIDNGNPYSTYKESEEEINSVASKFYRWSSQTLFDYGSDYKNIQSYNTEESWLLKNDIISNDVIFENLGNGLDYQNVDYIRVLSESSSIKKSDALMALYKANFGVIKSRPVVFWSRSPKTYVKVNKNLIHDFSEGYFYTYTSPNVYELYLTSLLDDGFLRVNEFNNQAFINQYDSLKTNKPSWFGSEVFDSRFSNSDPLGQSLSLVGTGNCKGLTHSSPNYFRDESITKIEFLKFIEKLLRVKTKDLTDLEAKMVTYKYGADYLLGLDEDVSKTLSYLIALGVLNFEDSSEFSNLYGDLIYEDFINILYRVANESARLDFSKIQLTDSDNYWLSKGFQEATIDLRSGIGPDIEINATVIPSTATNRSTKKVTRNKSIGTNRRNAPNEGRSKWKVVLTVPNSSSYSYKRTPVTSLTKDKFPEILEIEKASDKLTITFQIESTSRFAAMSVIKNCFTLSDASGTVIGTTKSVCKVEDNSGIPMYYLPKSAIQEIINKAKDTEIIPMEDKYLINTKTNTSAIFLDDDKKVLIGNEIIDVSSSTIHGVGGDVYYSLDVIVRLMSNSYISKFISGTVVQDVFSVGLGNTSNLTHGEQHVSVPVYGRSLTGTNRYDYAFVRNYNGLSKQTFKSYLEKHKDSKFDSYVKDVKKFGSNDKPFYMSLLHSSKVFNLLYKKISDTDYMVVRWVYCLPDSNSIPFIDQNSYYLNSSLDVLSAHNFLTQVPNNAVMQEWWDSNIRLSDAICNYLYGTEDVKYFTTGYAVPKVTFLSTDKEKAEDFSHILNALQLDSDYKTKYVEGGSLINSVFRDVTSKDSDPITYEDERTIEVIRGFENGDVIDYQGYVLDNTGVIYARVGDKGILDNVVYTENSNSLLTETRTKAQVTSPTSGSIYEFNKKEVEYMGTRVLQDLSGTSRSYYVFQPTKPQEITVARNSGTSKEWHVNDKSSTEDFVDWYNKEWVVNKDSMFTPSSDNLEGSLSRILAAPLKDTSEIDSNCSYLFSRTFREDTSINEVSSKLAVANFDSNSGKVVKKITDLSNLPNTCVNVSDFYNSPIYATPVIYLETSKWSFSKEKGETDKCKLVEAKMSPFLVRDNLYDSGISSNVIDSIVLSCYDSLSSSELPEGSTVIIGDLSFKVKSGTLYSNMQTDQQSVAKLMESLNNEENQSKNIKSILCNMFDGLSLNLIDNGSIAESNSLISYIQNDSNGKPTIDLAKCYSELGDNPRNLMSEGGVFYVQVGKTDKEKFERFVSSFSSFSFKVKFQSCVKFRPIDNTYKTFTLVSCVNSRGNGNLSHIPFMTSNLNYFWDSDDYGSVTNAEYAPAKYLEDLMNKIKQAYTNAFTGDLFSFLCFLIVNLFFYLIVMTLVATMVKSLATCRYFLDKIRHPSGDRLGPDILKIVSLGIVDFDSEISFVRTIGTVGLLAVALVIFTNIVY